MSHVSSHVSASVDNFELKGDSFNKPCALSRYEHVYTPLYVLGQPLICKVRSMTQTSSKHVSTDNNMTSNQAFTAIQKPKHCLSRVKCVVVCIYISYLF